MHGLNGYKEVIETMTWGLEQLGHQVSYAVNSHSNDSINIVYGAQVAPLDALKALPDNSICYNLEQLRGLTPENVKPQIKYCVSRFRMWDYSPSNVDAWRSLGQTDVSIVPIGYAPILTRIPEAKTQDIDVLLYGMSGVRRLQVVHDLSQLGITVVFVSGLYGAARDDLIARSRIVLNINLYQWAKIFEVVRVSYLLANRKAVVADIEPDTYVDEDIKGGIRFAPLKEIAANCSILIGDKAKRIALEEAGFEAISKRDIRKFLEVVL